MDLGERRQQPARRLSGARHRRSGHHRCSGSGYEVTVTKSDGSTVEAHLDQSFAVDDHSRPGG